MRSRSRPRSSVFMHMGPRTFPLALVERARRREVVYVRGGSSEGFTGRLLRRLSVHPISLEEQQSLHLMPASYDEPGAALAAKVEGWATTNTWQAIAEQVGGSDYANAVLRVMILKAAAPTYADVFAASTWVRNHGTDATVYASSVWEHLTVSSLTWSGQEVTCRHLPTTGWGAALSRLTKTVAVRLRPDPQSESVAELPFDRSTATVVNKSDMPRADATVLLVLNRGSTYGALFSYDFLLHMDRDVALSWSRAAVLSREGGELTNGYWSDPWPSSVDPITNRLRRLIPTGGRSGALPSAVRSLLSSGIARSESVATSLRTTYPSVRVAVYAFDAQIPAEISLALEILGIRSVALQERPATAVTATVPVAVETLLTASEYFSAATLRSASIAARHCVAVGMWRSDLLRGDQYDSDRLEGNDEPKRRGGRPLVVVLPYHVSTRAGAGDHPLATSTATMRHFIGDVLSLAREIPEADFVVRGKNADWLDLPELADVATRVKACPNVTVNKEYSRVNESYRLCQRATLVIAKHTSLVEECLSVGIPCLLHDYSWNYQDYERHTLPFIPRALWVESYAELLDKSREVLAGGDSDCRAAASEVMREIFGSWSDGNVRERVRSELSSLLG